MLVKVSSIANRGVQTLGVDVEVNISSRGIPGLEIIGLADKSVAESRDRVKTAFQNCGLEFPNRKITINLAPADINKEGSFYDLPIAVGLMCAVKDIKVPPKSLFFGEISFDGNLRHTKGSFLLSLYAKENGFENIFVPISCVKEASSVYGVSVFGVENLKNLMEHLNGNKLLISSSYVTNSDNYDSGAESKVEDYIDLKDILGQEQVKRALEICSAGSHNLIMVGPPGSGKTMMARSLISILPRLNLSESIDVTKIYSMSGKIPPDHGLIKVRPFRSPHHTISYAGMIGGGNVPSPGEITLAHRGVLFMDEFSEFSRSVLESLRQPLESGKITVSRSRFSVDFPSRFMLVASSNPCPCGYFGDPVHECKCSNKKISSYQSKLSGPILDRIDLHLNVIPVDKKKLSLFNVSGVVESSQEVRNRVLRARVIQTKRFNSENIITNSEMSNAQIKKYCKIKDDARMMLTQAAEKFGFSVRAYFKLIKVARTISDLKCNDDIDINDIAEAVQYRSKIFL